MDWGPRREENLSRTTHLITQLELMCAQVRGEVYSCVCYDSLQGRPPTQGQSLHLEGLTILSQPPGSTRVGYSCTPHCWHVREHVLLNKGTLIAYFYELPYSSLLFLTLPTSWQSTADDTGSEATNTNRGHGSPERHLDLQIPDAWQPRINLWAWMHNTNFTDE